MTGEKIPCMQVPFLGLVIRTKRPLKPLQAVFSGSTAKLFAGYLLFGSIVFPFGLDLTVVLDEADVDLLHLVKSQIFWII